MWIKSYVITIILVVLMSILTESLMPDTEMKKHISLVSGLVILFAIAKPIISIPDILSISLSKLANLYPSPPLYEFTF